jgi:hypothetical protein
VRRSLRPGRRIGEFPDRRALASRVREVRRELTLASTSVEVVRLEEELDGLLALDRAAAERSR